MRFSDVVGQERVKDTLRTQADGGRLPHSIMLTGPQGAGKLALALAFGRYLVCHNPHDGEPCGVCPSCRMSEGWMHPDLHFSFPVYKKKSTDHPISDDFIAEWRDQISGTPYFEFTDWMERLGAGNQQPVIYVDEADALQRKLSIKASQGGNKVVILWMPERLMEETSNKLLKLIEEPPAKTHFILVTQEPQKLLATIVSRTQEVHVPPLREQDIAQALKGEGGEDGDTDTIAHMAHGNLTRALKALHDTRTGENGLLDMFTTLMRTCYARDVRRMKTWSDKAAGMGRERQKMMLEYFQRMVRENFVYNFGRQKELNYMTREESDFSRNFARFVNERNVMAMTDALSLAQRDIEQNVNARMVFYDMAVQMTILIRK